MTSIITAWLVKLATRVLRNQLEGLHSKIDYLDQNLDTALAEHRRQSQQLKAEAELAHSRGLQLCDALGRIETLSNRCDTFRSQMLDQAATIRDYQAENKRLQSIVTLHHRQLAEQSAMLDKVRAERDSHLTALNAAVGVTNAMKDDLENIRTENEVLRRQLDNQAATIREYQAEKENLHCCIDVLQANVSGWSKLFDEMKHRMGMSEDRAKSLRREIDVFTVWKDSTTGAGSASKASDSAGGSAGAQPMQTSVEPVKDVWPKYYVPRGLQVLDDGRQVAYYRRDNQRSGETFCKDGTTFGFDGWDLGGGGIEVSEEVAKLQMLPKSAAPEADGCVSCGAPVVPGTAGCKDCNEYALEAVGAPRCLTEKQVFVMSYLAVRTHSFRTIEGFIDSNVMAAIHTDAEKLWDMLQRGLEKG